MQSLERSIQVLGELSRNPEGISLGELAKATGLPKPTISRILNTLKEAHFARQDKHSHRYFLGLGILELTFDYLSGLDLHQAALPHMRDLNTITQETVNLGVLDGFNIIYIERIESRQMLRTTSPVGKRTAAFSTALGKAILAFADDETVRESIYTQPLEKLTPLTIVDPSEIEAELKKIQKSGIALDDRENQEHVRCIASPIFEARGHVVAAISISAPASRIDFDQAEELKAQVLSTARAISTQLGWVGG